MTNKKNELEAKYELYRQNKSLKYWGLAYLLGVSLMIVAYVLYVTLNFPAFNPMLIFMSIYIAAGVFMSVITGKIALKTGNNVMIFQFFGYSIVTIWVVFITGLTHLNKWTLALESFIVLAIILIIMVYITEKKLKRKMYGGNWILNAYRTVVIKEAEQIDLLTDGYSGRPFSMDVESLKHVENFKNKADDFAKILGREGIIMDWNVNEDSVTLFPAIFMEDFFASASYIISLIFRKKKLSWVKLSSGGQITVFVSDEDYKRITRPVAYHILCRRLAEKFEKSFIEFTGGNKENSVKIITGK